MGYKESLIERAAAAAWKRDYPKGGSLYPTYESTNFQDKEIYREEVAPIIEELMAAWAMNDEALKQIESKFTDERMCINGRWWIPADYETANPKRESVSLLKKPNTLPEGCYCQPGKCAAPKPGWCRDAKKRDTQIEDGSANG